MNLGLFTDLYELRMLQAYWVLTHDEVAVFSLFVRRLPPKRNFLIACGLDDLLAEIEAFRFDADDLAYLATQGFPQYDIVARFSEAQRGFARFPAAGFCNEGGIRVAPSPPLPRHSVTDNRRYGPASGRTTRFETRVSGIPR